MKILLISEFFPPHWTGISKAAFYLAKQLQDDSHMVTVLTTQFDKHLKQKEIYNGINIYRSTYLFKFSRTYYSLKIIFDAASIYRLIDVVIINSPNSNIFFLTLIAKLMGKKVIIFHQGDLVLPKKSGHQLINRIIEKIFDVMTLLAMIIANRISTYTEDYAKNSRVMKYFLNKFSPYIPQMFNNSDGNTSDGVRMHSSEVKEEQVVIGFAGRFVEEKGFDILFRAIPEIIKKIPNSHFVFAGQKQLDYEPFYEKNKPLFDSMNKYVTFLGLLNDNDLAKFYCQLDVFVISSRSDCFPLTQIEAVLSSVPIVVTDIPGARMLVKKSGFGKIVMSENPTALAKGIIEVINNKKQFLSHQKSVLNFLKKYEKFVLD